MPWLPVLVDGLTVGASYGLVAMGFTLVHGVLRRIDLAFGATIMLALYAALWLHVKGLLPVWAMALAVPAAAVLCGRYVDRLCFAPHRHRAALVSMAASFAVWMQLQEAATLLLPRHVQVFPVLLPDRMWAPVGLVAAPVIEWTSLGAALLAAASLMGLVHRSRFGQALRALVEQPELATLCGVATPRLRQWGFMLASLYGGLAGYVLVNVQGQITPMFAMWVTLKGLSAAALGGLGSLGGAAWAGVAVGIAESVALRVWGAPGRDLCVDVIMLMALACRGRSQARGGEGAGSASGTWARAGGRP